ncbi:hypothetical protein [Rhodococcoides kyotonense]|nr:hypothetical protein [Rhodococcus kyotonensis]
MREAPVWYVSYGSNLLAERFATYLTGSPATGEFGFHPPAPSPTPPAQDRWMWIDHALYFAGVSQRWTGSGAFVSTQSGSDPSVAHGYLIEHGQLAHLLAVENVVDDIVAPDPTSIDVGGYAHLDIDRRGEAFRGKYDAVLRLPDIDGIPAVTVTSSIVREHGTPSARYVATIRRGLESSPLELDVDAYLSRAIRTNAAGSDQRV